MILRFLFCLILCIDVGLLIVLVFYFQISRPEDWEKAVDPKKYFVQFFGTNEM